MSTVTMNISLNEDLKAFVDARVQARGYSSHSEYVRHLVRQDEEAAKLERLRGLIADGMASPPARPWPELRDEFNRRLSERGL